MGDEGLVPLAKQFRYRWGVDKGFMHFSESVPSHRTAKIFWHDSSNSGKVVDVLTPSVSREDCIDTERTCCKSSHLSQNLLAFTWWKTVQVVYH